MIPPRIPRRFFWVLLSCVCLGLTATRGLLLHADVLSPPTYKALVIGINDYSDNSDLGWKDLKAATRDTEALVDLLKTQYGFLRENITYLKDGEATRERILEALDAVMGKATAQDAVLLYYAGHGAIRGGEYYWVPSNATRRDRIHLEGIPTSPIEQQVRTSAARHILLVVDSCFAGYMGGTRSGTPPEYKKIDPLQLDKQLREPGRHLLVSTDRTTALDETFKPYTETVAFDGHSPFAAKFLGILRNNPVDWLEARALEAELAQQLYKETRQWADLKTLKHEYGGMFIFHKVTATQSSAAAPTVGLTRAGDTESSPTPAPPKTYSTPLPGSRKQTPASIEWLPVPGTGSSGFLMGSPDEEGSVDEHPRHKVTIKPFLLSKTEVTVAQYAACVQAGKCTEPARAKGCTWKVEGLEQHPVNCVNWSQTQEFAAWVSGVARGTVRLPTEAEWEYAARGSSGKLYPWGDADPTSELTNFKNAEEGTTPVGQYPQGASWMGALDLAGNVWEWTEDCWHDHYTSAPKDGSAWTAGCIVPEKWRQAAQNELSLSEADPLNIRIIRGGGWGSGAERIRGAVRFNSHVRSWNWVVGFRLVLQSLPTERPKSSARHRAPDIKRPLPIGWGD